MKNMKEIMLYALLLVPTTTELLETGHFPATPRDIITDVVMTIVVLALILASRRKKKILQKLKEEIIQIEKSDPLTGLPMRACFNEDLKSAIQKAKDHKLNLHLACIDIDHFKTVNEHYGSDMGDALLQQLVQRIKSIVPDNRGSIYRLGGDSFALLFSEEAEKDITGTITNLVTLSASGNQLLESYESSVTIGTAKLSPNDDNRDFWQRAVQDMRKKRKEIEQDAA